MPHSLHRVKGSEQTGNPQRLRSHPTHDGAVGDRTDQELLLQRIGDPATWHAGTLERFDAGARRGLVTALQRTFGNNHVQRLIAGGGLPSTHIHRCGGETPCGCASEEDGIRRIQRLGQSALDEQPPRSASLTVVSSPPRRDEEETRPPAR